MAKVLPIRHYGDPILREPSQDVPAVTPELRGLAEDMIATMKAANGVGLAAQQIGRRESILVLNVPASCDEDEETGERLNPGIPMPMAILNPKLLNASAQTESCEEGCLSFPEITGSVKRAWQVEVEYLALDGGIQTLTLQGYMARALQHEMDHLQGKLFIDRFSHVKRLAVRNKLKHLQQQTQDELGTP